MISTFVLLICGFNRFNFIRNFFSIFFVIGGLSVAQANFSISATVNITSVMCHSVKISDKHYLTAAHCFNSRVTGNSVGFSHQSDLVRMIVIVDANGNTFTPRLNWIKLHPSWRKVISKKDTFDHIAKEILNNESVSDLALIEVVETLPIPSAVLSFDSLRVTEYGVAGVDLPNDTLTALTRFGQYVLLDSVSRQHPDQFVQFGPGDSGSPVVVLNTQGKQVVVGILCGIITAKFSSDWLEPRDIFFASRLEQGAGNHSVQHWLCNETHGKICGQ
jgi:hypothetical protein